MAESRVQEFGEDVPIQSVAEFDDGVVAAILMAGAFLASIFPEATEDILKKLVEFASYSEPNPIEQVLEQADLPE